MQREIAREHAAEAPADQRHLLARFRCAAATTARAAPRACDRSRRYCGRAPSLRRDSRARANSGASARSSMSPARKPGSASTGWPSPRGASQQQRRERERGGEFAHRRGPRSAAAAERAASALRPAAGCGRCGRHACPPGAQPASPLVFFASATVTTWASARQTPARRKARRRHGPRLRHRGLWRERLHRQTRGRISGAVAPRPTRRGAGRWPGAISTSSPPCARRSGARTIRRCCAPTPPTPPRSPISRAARASC